MNNQTHDQLPTTSVANEIGVWTIYRSLVGVGVVCALLVVSVFILTKPVIEKNRSEAVEQAVYAVLPGAMTKQTYILKVNGSLERLEKEPSSIDQSDGELVYAGYDKNQNLVGLALLAQGRGYQDRILLMYGYAATSQTIVGLKVLESRETPGLGDKIETDPVFKANFYGLDVSLDAELQSLANKIVAVKHGYKTQPWHIDGITGATVSSEAIANILNNNASKWVPHLYAQRAHVELNYQGESGDG